MQLVTLSEFQMLSGIMTLQMPSSLIQRIEIMMLLLQDLQQMRLKSQDLIQALPSKLIQIFRRLDGTATTLPQSLSPVLLVCAEEIHLVSKWFPLRTHLSTLLISRTISTTL